MKKFKILFTISCLFLAWQLNAQKIGVVDTNYLLNQFPEYKAAESRLNAQIATWKTEIENLESEYESKKAAFESEKVLLVGEQLKQREKEVLDLEKNIKTTLSLRYGTNGEIEQLRKNLVEPFQDQIWDAIKEVSEKNNLGIVFDKSNNVSVIFLHKRYDYTEKVLNYILRQSGEQPEKKK